MLNRLAICNDIEICPNLFWPQEQLSTTSRSWMIEGSTGFYEMVFSGGEDLVNLEVD